MELENRDIDSDQKMYANRVLDRRASPLPAIRPALITTIISAVVARGCVAFLAVLAGPPILGLLRELWSSGLSDPRAIESSLRGLLSPGLWLVGAISLFAVGATVLGAVWLLIVLLMRGINR
jgi:hypothetical protein